MLAQSMKNQRQHSGPFEENFEPPHTTIHCGTVEGGTAGNIVPKHCTVESEWRFIPSENPDDLMNELKQKSQELEEEMQSVIPGTGIDIEVIASGPGLDTSEDSQVVVLAQKFSGSLATHKVSYMTEAGHFCAAGVPTVVIGPGSIEQAHKPNEFVSVEQMQRCEKFMEEVLHFVQQ